MVQRRPHRLDYVPLPLDRFWRLGDLLAEFRGLRRIVAGPPFRGGITTRSRGG
jgi:hypothetical protein